MTALDDRTSAPPRSPQDEPAEGLTATSSPSTPNPSPEVLAAAHARTGAVRAPGLRRWLPALGRRMGAVYARLADAPDAVGARPLAAEWLLDNQHVIQEALGQVQENLPWRFYRELPALLEGRFAGKTRVHALARALVDRGDGHVELDVAPRFLAAYQELAPLSMGELWALPAFLRLVVLEDLIVEAERLFGAAPAAGVRPDSVPAGDADPNRIPVYVLGLRELATQDWRTFFEEASRVEALLRAEPAGVHARMDFATRDAYRKAVERVAREGGRRSGAGEEAAARTALDLSAEHADDGRRGHVGWWLVERGRAQLATRLGVRSSPLSAVVRWMSSRPVGLYLASVIVASAALLGAALAYARRDTTALQSALLLLLAVVPAVTVAVAYVNWIAAHTVHPRLLPKLDPDLLEDGRYRTLVVVPCVLTDVEDVRQQLRQLEINYLGNSSPLLSYALLVDLADAGFQHLAEDGALVEAARLGVEKLNERHRRPEGGPFHLLHRERRWNGRESLWMGWERKRGKLHELNRLLAGEDTSFVGDGGLPAPRPFRYVITVDADTFLPPTAALQLVATMAHPLNEPELDAGGAVLSGYTVLQPRLETLPASAGSSAFARVFEADTGLDLYTHAVSDVYQDLTGEGIFAGKGIYRVDAFERSLEGRVPENALLSHDLFEGLLGRAGLVSDVALFEHFPAHVLTYMRRLHRWVRGDWQLLPWLRGRVPGALGRVRSHLSILDRWKILDNLRRSLLAPSLLGLLVAGWLWLPGPAWIWSLVVTAVLATPIVLQGATTVNQVVRARRVRERPGPTLEPPGLVQGLRSLGNDAWRLFLGIVFLPFEAYVVADAVVRTLWRLAVSRRRLLEWTTAAHAARAMGRRASSAFVWRSMAPATLLALAILAVVVWVRPEALPGALPFLLAWLVSPEIAHRVSRPRQPAALPAFVAPDRAALRRLARRTWLYFQHFIGPEDAWLPPDNFQEEPGRIVARRTSPTNVGLSLLSALGAHDLGYVGTRTLAATLRNVFDGLERLERYRGHFLNWYDTRALVPLPPRYVSTVDSGNLAASLLTLSTAAAGLARAPILPRRLARGFLDTLSLLLETVRRVEEPHAADSRRAIDGAARAIRTRVTSAVEEPASLPIALADVSASLLPELESHAVSLVVTAPVEVEPALVREIRIWLAALREDLVLWQKEVEELAPWLAFLSRTPALYAREDFRGAEAWRALRAVLPVRPVLGRAPKACRRARKRLARLEKAVEREAEAVAGRTSGVGPAGVPAELLDEARSWNDGLSEALERGIRSNETLLADLREVSATAERLVAEMDFGFLFDRRRRLFHIGYDATAGSPDPNYYDLLASEARLASFVAIAKGNVPPAHWLHLGRPLARVDGTRALLSWGGTMFEYLMPSLLMRHPSATLLGLSCRAAVDRQIAYAADLDAPWGVSESGFHELDPRANYRYAAFGVPGLGLRRDLGRRLVVSPYASLLALPFRPRAVEKNVEELERLGMLGRYGLFEALDLGRPELPREPRVVQSYMTHHQGMILVALVNALRERVMVARFHAHPLAATAEHLLHERIPWHAPLRVPLPDGGGPRAAALRALRAEGWPVPRHPVLPQLHVLSNGRFSVWITASGASGSRWRDRALTRWRPDPTAQVPGDRLYLQDAASGEFWTVGRDPVPGPGQHEVVRFAPHGVQFSRRRRGIGVKLEVTVPPGDDLEIRRVRLVNHAARARRLAVVTYAEPVLAPPADDRRHPAFQKLFLETAWLPEHRALLSRRRLRSAADEPLVLLHALLYAPDAAPRVTFETDRGRFLGRLGSVQRPAALAAGALPLAGTPGATLDPVLALRCRVDLPPRGEAELAFVTVVGRSRADVLAPLERYRSASRVEWAFRQARTGSEHELQELGIGSDQAREMQELLSALVHPCHALRAGAETLAANRLSRRALWRHGVSGDHPILLVRVERPEDAPVAREALLAHAFWRVRRVEFDVVVVNEEPPGYAQPLQERLEDLIAETEGGAWRDQRAGIFLLRGPNLEPDDRTLLASAAAVVLDASRGSLARQLERLREQPLELPGFVPTPSSPLEPQPAIPWRRCTDLAADNGLGGFSPDGREYVIELEAGRVTPAPWCNVVANAGFGFLVSESGGGFTWSAHSAENRLTPWRNDPVSDEPGEALYLRDEETGEIWSPTPRPAGGAGPESSYRVRHGAGYTAFEHRRHGLDQRLTAFAAREEPVKLVHLRLENRWNRPRRITATYYVEWVLGDAREETVAHVVPDYDHPTGAILARNPFHATFGGRVAFLAASREPHGLTTDRREFLGAAGDLGAPAGLSRIGLSGAVRPGTDPCAALQVHLELGPGESQEVHFVLGQGLDRDHAVSLAGRFRDPAAVAAERERVDELWDTLLGAVSVRTPDPAMDLVLNRWLLYQALACRLWGRSALYQSSGAFGFRDQLQDVLALVHAAPQLAREHLLESARHQFEEGDVLHWWHPPAGEGVRTRCSDDLLWLPYATAAYVRATGDAGVLEEDVPYLAAEPLRLDEDDRYARFETGVAGTLYEHCLRAITRGDTRGRHDLPLIGAHDWNDGLNRVGAGGEGESVWLAWFLRAVLLDFAPLCEERGDAARAAAMRERADELARAVDGSAWDGRWYLRAWYDDGATLGSAQDREARIDSLPQSWAVLAGGDPVRAGTAMDSVLEHLVRRDPALCCLFWPPFDRTPRDPGYVKGYPPGVRENGGQYSHAAAWVGWAFAERGEGDRAHAVFDLLNPVRRADTPAAADLYRVEPYVIAADVYSHPPHAGRGGWTWYTGSAAWTWRLGVEAILGLRRERGGLRIDPCIPRDWPGFHAVYRVGRSSWHVRVENPRRVSRGVEDLTLDGASVRDGVVPLADDGREHAVVVRMGAPRLGIPPSEPPR